MAQLRLHATPLTVSRKRPYPRWIFAVAGALVVLAAWGFAELVR